MAYKSKFTGEQVDELLTQIEEGDLDITVDTELSTTSPNAIANSAVATALLGKQDTLTLSVNDNGNIVIGNLVIDGIAGQSKEFMPATPSGVPEHYTWLAIDGVTYGTFTGKDGNTYGQDGKWGVYAEYGGLSDLSNEDMYIIMSTGKRQTNDKGNLFAQYTGRTNIIEDNNPWSMDARMSYTSLFRSAINLEVANLVVRSSGTYGSPVMGTSLQLAFSSCRKLHSVIIGINVSAVTSYDRTFLYCESLQNIKLKGLKASVSFADSPNLSKESILYIIENEAATSAIVITLHDTAYAMAIADTDISAALAEHTNVSLGNGSASE